MAKHANQNNAHINEQLCVINTDATNTKEKQIFMKEKAPFFWLSSKY